MIAYNVQPLAQQNLTGIGNYAKDVLKCLLPKSEEYELHVFDFLARNGASSIVGNHLGIPGSTDKIKVTRSIPLSVYIRMGNAGRAIPYKFLTGSDSDLTVFFNYLAPAALKEKSIITIYDMVCERFPETMDDRNRKLLRKHLLPSARRASAIVTISEFSKREIMELLNIPEEKIFVAPCGVDSSFYKPASQSEAGMEREYLKNKWGLDKFILYVGTLEPRKNTKVLVKAFEKIADDYPDYKLVLAGGVGWHAEETLGAIENSSVKDRIVRTGYVSNEEKRMLLRSTGVFVFPSIYEGFGMPVTEAMACGTPCVIADTSSLPEASRGLAPAVDAHDADAFACAVSETIDRCITAEERAEIIAAASEFRWENAADVYKEAINYANRSV